MPDVFDATVDLDADQRGLYGPVEIVGDDYDDGVSAAEVLGDDEAFVAEAAEILGLLAGKGAPVAVPAAVVAPTGPEAAAKATIEQARDSRQPAPKMKAVPVDEPPMVDEAQDEMVEFMLGASEGVGADLFPITSRLVQRFAGDGGEPKYVRVDTEKSYEEFRAAQSPELAALKAQVSELSAAFERHAHDPDAHDMLDADLEAAEVMGAEVAATEASKKVELWLPKHYDGLVTAWREGGFVCASLRLPGADGEVRICTSMKPIVKFVDEMTKHASAAKASAPDVIGVLPEMGCCLGAGTAVKEVAAAAPSILARPESKGGEAFVCRIEPKAKPSLAALIALHQMCCAGDKQACAEWEALAAAATKGGAGPLAQAMREATTKYSQVQKAA